MFFHDPVNQLKLKGGMLKGSYCFYIQNYLEPFFAFIPLTVILNSKNLPIVNTVYLCTII